MIPRFEIQANPETGILLIQLLEEEWVSHEEMTAVNTMLLLKVTKHIGQRLDEVAVESMRIHGSAILERFAKKHMIYYNFFLNKWCIPGSLGLQPGKPGGCANTAVVFRARTARMK